MDEGAQVLLVMLLAFASAALLVHAVIQTVGRRQLVRQQFGALSPVGGASGPRRGSRLDAGRLGVDPGTQRQLRRDLIRAGYFSQDDVAIYTLARWGVILLLPLMTLAVLWMLFSHWDTPTRLAIVAIIIIVAFYLPRAFISRQQRLLQDKYRVTFPDFLDMLVVCVNAGLGLDAALDRVSRELGPDDVELRANLELMAGEMRAGKSSVEALKDCAERLGLPEAQSLATLLQQSIELGTDVALSLTTFSDEMRDKRMSRAEERAASLPPKLTLPLGLFIFPVVLIVILAPVVLRISKASF